MHFHLRKRKKKNQPFSHQSPTSLWFSSCSLVPVTNPPLTAITHQYSAMPASHGSRPQDQFSPRRWGQEWMAVEYSTSYLWDFLSPISSLSLPSWHMKGGHQYRARLNIDMTNGSSKICQRNHMPWCPSPVVCHSKVDLRWRELKWVSTCVQQTEREMKSEMSCPISSMW